tara:strand:- start:94249 stop:94443 length:195 start_codon:yes stop_codon:yes gene_type:complete
LNSAAGDSHALPDTGACRVEMRHVPENYGDFSERDAKAQGLAWGLRKEVQRNTALFAYPEGDKK